MPKPFIFCISVNCSKVTAVMLRSFHKHHPNEVIHVIGTSDEFVLIEELYPDVIHNTVFVDISFSGTLMQSFKQGHRGTTTVFAMVIQGQIKPYLPPSSPFYSNNYTSFIHLDTDLYFKQESISIIEKELEEHAIVGTRRCYGNNPSGIAGLENWPDTISTYIFGMRLDNNFLAGYNMSFEKLCRYCEGAEHPLGWLVLDTFDGVTHAIMNAGGEVCYLDRNQFGSQDEHGKKVNNYASNMHMDCGSHLIHFGGTGSGHAVWHGHSTPPIGYAKWAVGRYGLFAKLFYNEEIERYDTVYGPDGRWINGGYDENILQTLIKDMQ